MINVVQMPIRGTAFGLVAPGMKIDGDVLREPALVISDEELTVVVTGEAHQLADKLRRMLAEVDMGGERRADVPAEVWVLRRQGQHTNEVSIHTSREGGLAALAIQVRSSWDTVSDLAEMPATPPENDEEAVLSYYGPDGQRGDEQYSLYSETAAQYKPGPAEGVRAIDEVVFVNHITSEPGSRPRRFVWRSGPTLCCGTFEDYAKAWGRRVHRTYSDRPSRQICLDQREDPATEPVRFDGPAFPVNVIDHAGEFSDEDYLRYTLTAAGETAEIDINA